jgi:hypothetical protein
MRRGHRAMNGTIDPIAELSDVAVERGVPIHVDGCLGGWIFPWGQDLGYENIPVFDFMRTRGWRFNGQQNPNGIHMCETGPQTKQGVTEAFADDLAAAVTYAKDPPQPEPKSGGVYGGDVGLDLTDPEVAKPFLIGALDPFSEYPL